MEDLVVKLTRALMTHASELLALTNSQVMILIETPSGSRYWSASGKLKNEFENEEKIAKRKWGMKEVSCESVASSIEDVVTAAAAAASPAVVFDDPIVSPPRPVSSRPSVSPLGRESRARSDRNTPRLGNSVEREDHSRQQQKRPPSSTTVVDSKPDDSEVKRARPAIEPDDVWRAPTDVPQQQQPPPPPRAQMQQSPHLQLQQPPPQAQQQPPTSVQLPPLHPQAVQHLQTFPPLEIQNAIANHRQQKLLQQRQLQEHHLQSELQRKIQQQQQLQLQQQHHHIMQHQPAGSSPAAAAAPQMYDPAQPTEEPIVFSSAQAEKDRVEFELNQLREAGKLRFSWLEIDQVFLIVRKNEQTHNDVLARIASYKDLQTLKREM